MTRLTYRAVWVVDDLGSEELAGVVRRRLGPPIISVGIETVFRKVLEGITHRPEIGAVSVVARPADAAPLDPDGPFATPSGQDLLAAFLTDLLAWDAREQAGWARLDEALVQRARGLLAGLIVGDLDRAEATLDEEHGDVRDHPHLVDGRQVTAPHVHGNHEDGTPCYGADHEQTWMGLTPAEEEQAVREAEAEEGTR